MNMLSGSFFALYFNRRMAAMVLLGFASGLPLALTASTLTVWLSEAGVSKAAIGLFAAVGTPYALKFLWSPLMDGVRLPLLGRALGQRRSWIILTQFLLFVGLMAMGTADPSLAPWWTALLAVCVATASASQDIVLDAYRVEWLKPEEQAAGSASFVFGYRLGMITASAGALYLATYVGWQATYSIMALCVGVGAVTVLLAGEPVNPHMASRQGQTLTLFVRESVIAPFTEFMSRTGWINVLLFVLLYKFADAFMGVMTNPFLLELGFTKTDIAGVVKLYGLVATIAGGFIGGAMVFRLGMIKSLWICGILQGLTNLVFMAQAYVGADIGFLAVTITLENLSGGMGTAAFVAYMSSLCNLRFTATHYALLSSFAAFGRTWLSTPAGLVAQAAGWPVFFALATLLAIPGLLALWWLTRRGRGEG